MKKQKIDKNIMKKAILFLFIFMVYSSLVLGAFSQNVTNDLRETDAGDFLEGQNIWEIVFNPNDNKIYMIADFYDFSPRTIARYDPSTNVTENLTKTNILGGGDADFNGIWLDAMDIDTSNNLMYIGGDVTAPTTEIAIYNITDQTVQKKQINDIAPGDHIDDIEYNPDENGAYIMQSAGDTRFYDLDTDTTIFVTGDGTTGHQRMIEYDTINKKLWIIDRKQSNLLDLDLLFYNHTTNITTFVDELSPHDSVSSSVSPEDVIYDSLNNRVYIASTIGTGSNVPIRLSYFDIVSQTLNNITKEIEGVSASAGFDVISLDLDSFGLLYITTEPHGLWRYDPSSDIMDNISDTYEFNPNGDALFSNSITIDNNNNVYIGFSNDMGSGNPYFGVYSPLINPPVANFTSDVTSGTVPFDVNFTDTSTNSPTSFSWLFGDGNTSTAQNPVHTYETAGTYTVTLTANNSGGGDLEVKVNFIVASAPVSAPVASTLGIQETLSETGQGIGDMVDALRLPVGQFVLFLAVIGGVVSLIMGIVFAIRRLATKHL